MDKNKLIESICKIMPEELHTITGTPLETIKQRLNIYKAGKIKSLTEADVTLDTINSIKDDIITLMELKNDR